MAPQRGRPLPPPPGGFAWGVGPFCAGDMLLYWDAAAGGFYAVVVLHVDASVHPPAYVVQLHGGQTRDTEARRLARVAFGAEEGKTGGKAAPAPASSPRRSARRSGGGGASPQVVKAGAAVRRGNAAAAPAGEDRSPKRARASVAGGGASRRREEEEEEPGGRRGGMGLVHIAVTAMAVTTAALAALRLLQH